MPEFDRYLVFQYLENIDIKAFKLIPKLDRWLVFRYLTEKTEEAAELVPEIHRKFIFYNASNEEAIKIYKEEGIKHQNYLNIFLNLPKKTIETFEILPERDRAWAFKYLDERSVDAFKLIPEKNKNNNNNYYYNKKYRIDVFRFLDDKSFDTID